MDNLQIEKMQLQIVGDHQCLLGECPVWDHISNTIIWVDILKGEIHEYNAKESSFKTLSVHELIGSVALCKDGNLVAGLQSGFAFINRTNERILKIADPESHLPDNRFNDGKCDPAGRFLSGTMSLLKKNFRAAFMLWRAIVLSQKNWIIYPFQMEWHGV